MSYIALIAGIFIVLLILYFLFGDNFVDLDTDDDSDYLYWWPYWRNWWPYWSPGFWGYGYQNRYWDGPHRTAHREIYLHNPNYSVRLHGGRAPLHTKNYNRYSTNIIGRKPDFARGYRGAGRHSGGHGGRGRGH